MSAKPPDPIDDLEHGHAELGALVLDLRETLSRVEAGELEVDEGASELCDAATALKEAMAIHFSRESEALFPFVEQHVPAFVARVEALGVEHDAVCKQAEELYRACARLATTRKIAGVVDELAKLELAYRGHAAVELTFLDELRGALDDERREELRQLLLGL